MHKKDFELLADTLGQAIHEAPTPLERVALHDFKILLAKRLHEVDLRFDRSKFFQRVNERADL